MEISARVLKGEGSLITVRGKRKLGYELTVELSFHSKDMTSSPIKLILEEICEDEDDCMNVSTSS